jgi:uncharacterized membrane protein YphA (DoxX/SURF4 family)
MTGTILLILALVFAAAGVAKLRSPDPFKAGLRKLVPPRLVEPLTILVPAAELALATWLATGRATRPAAWCAAALLTCFTLVLLKMWRIGLQGCGCFGEQAEGPGIATGVTRNLLLLAASLLLATGPPHPAIYQPTLAGLTGQATLVLGVACLWACASTAAARWKWIASRSLPT